MVETSTNTKIERRCHGADYPAAAKAIAKIGSTMTYDDVPCIVDERNDSCPYLGHVPYFAPKLSSSFDQRNR